MKYLVTGRYTNYHTDNAVCRDCRGHSHAVRMTVEIPGEETVWSQAAAKEEAIRRTVAFHAGDEVDTYFIVKALK